MKNSILEVLDAAQAQWLSPVPEILEQITLSASALEGCREACKQVLRGCGADLENAEWFNEDWLKSRLQQASERFDRAFDRWRELFRSAGATTQAQQLKQLAYLGKGPASQQETGRAEAMEREAKRQLDPLCCKDTKFDESDFYPYRYLASEGFLPGYNFPALPVRIFVPRGTDGEFISRPDCWH